MHWPVIAFANNAYMGEQPVSVRIMLIAISVVLGLALYYGVERPIHRMKSVRVRTAIPAAISSLAAIFIIPTVLPSPANSVEGATFKDFRALNTGLNVKCSQHHKYSQYAECQTTPVPTVHYGETRLLCIYLRLLTRLKKQILCRLRELLAPLFWAIVTSTMQESTIKTGPRNA
jgi:hypothetical protein